MEGILTNDLEEIIDPLKLPFLVENCLGELNEGQKFVARENLGVYDKDLVYTKDVVSKEIKRIAADKVQEHLSEDDPHGTLAKVDKRLDSEFIKNDGTTPFLAPLEGKDPIKDFHLATKRFVDKILEDHKKEADPHYIKEKIEEALEPYANLSDVYTRKELEKYVLKAISSGTSLYIKPDGTTPFTNAQAGADPRTPNHLTTKRYVDDVIYLHLVNVDPHGFISILNKRLADYAKSSLVLPATLTYSRVQIDTIVRSLVLDAAKEVMLDHLKDFDPHGVLSEIRKEKYIKLDGTVPFKKPLRGVDAVSPWDLVTLQQVEERIEEIKLILSELPQPIWITSGPVEASVGMVKEGDTLAHEVNFQEAMDAIFYGKRVKLTVPEQANIGDIFPITLCILGSLATIEYAEIYLDGVYYGTITKEDLESSSCVTIDSLPIKGDTEITAKVFYTNGSTHEVSETIKVALPVFVGKIPLFKFGYTLTYKQLQELELEDPINNKFYDKGEHLQSLEHNYNFDEPKEQKLIVVLPEKYNDLSEMYNSALAVNGKAFEVINKIPFLVPGSDEDIIYKIYFYKLDLFSLNTLMTFKFK